VVIATHCQSVEAGTLTPGQIPPNQVGSNNVTTSDATGGAGHRRGIVCFLHPSQASDLPRPFGINPPSWDPFNSFVTFTSDVNTDGWILDYPAMPVDWGIGVHGYFTSVYNQTAADATHGQILVNSHLEWWDHYLLNVASRYGAGRAVVLAGFSWGTWVAMQIVLGRTSTVAGAMMHALPTLWQNIPSSFFGLNMAAVNWSAMNVSTTALNAISVPTVIGYSETDGVVGWNLAGTPNSTPVSNVDSIITNAQGASQPCSRFRSYGQGGSNTGWDEGTAAPNGHLFLPNDVATYVGATMPLPQAWSATAGWLQTVIDPTHPVSF
jgi:pimeloyl-ACP methyl ester carboxylesterase